MIQASQTIAIIVGIVILGCLIMINSLPFLMYDKVEFKSIDLKKKAELYWKLAASTYQFRNGDEITNFTCSCCKSFTETAGYSLTKIELLYNSKYFNFGYLGYNEDNQQIYLIWRGCINPTNLDQAMPVEIADVNKDIFPTGKGKILSAQLKLLEDFNVYIKAKFGFDTLQDKVTDYYTKQNAKGLIVIGHSLGGNLAKYTSVMIQDYWTQNKKDCKILEVFAFSPTKTGDQEFTDYYNTVMANAEVKFLVNYRDPVPRLPIYKEKTTNFTLYHSGEEVYTEGNKKFIECKDLTEQEQMDQQVCLNGQILNFVPLQYWASNYVNHIAKDDPLYKDNNFALTLIMFLQHSIGDHSPYFEDSCF